MTQEIPNHGKKISVFPVKCQRKQTRLPDYLMYMLLGKTFFLFPLIQHESFSLTLNVSISLITVILKSNTQCIWCISESIAISSISGPGVSACPRPCPCDGVLDSSVTGCDLALSLGDHRMLHDCLCVAIEDLYMQEASLCLGDVIHPLHISSTFWTLLLRDLQEPPVAASCWKGTKDSMVSWHMLQQIWMGLERLMR